MADKSARDRVAAVVLAAGGSTRMGRPKALLPLRGKTYLEVALGTLGSCDVEPLLVVLGSSAGDVLERVDLGRAVALLNRDWQRGMLGSLQLAVRHLIDERPRATALLVALVDTPLFAATTVQALAQAFRGTGSPVVLPRHRGEHGHPVLFGRAAWDELLAASDGSGARAVVDAHRHDLVEVDVDDPWVLRDADTPAEHEQMQRRDSQRQD